MDILNNMNKMIKFHRKQSGLSQLDLANLAGVGKTVIYDLEKGKRTILCSTLIKVLNALNIRIIFDSPLMKTFKEFSNEKG